MHCSCQMPCVFPCLCFLELAKYKGVYICDEQFTDTQVENKAIMQGRGANKCHPIACACTDICSPDALLGGKHFTIIITSSIHVYGWLDSCLLFSCKICPYCKFCPRPTRYPIIFTGGGRGSLREASFPRHTT